METVHDMQAILGEDFFKEEVRCDYLVTAKMKRIWAVELDMYLSFAEICEKYGLNHFLIAGSLLGAVRHNGFIPWDDDMDIGMTRDDYDEFLRLATKNNDFKYPLFLQTPYTDPESFVTWAKIRNSATTGVSKVTSHRKFNQGLFLDVFPMDFCDPATIEKDTQSVFVSAKKLGAWMRRGSKFMDDRQRQDEITYYTDSPLQEWENIQKVASNPAYLNSGFVCNTVYTGDPFRFRMHPAKCYSEIIECPFESITVKIPAGYDELLKIMYNDYMSFPPIESRGIRHSNLIFDPDIPYTEYLKDLS